MTTMTHTEHTAASSDTPQSKRRGDRRRGSTDGNSAHQRADQPRPLAPDLRQLDARSARAWTEAMTVAPLGEGRYEVTNASGRTYVVDLPGSDCSCPDQRIRGERCKHLRRVAIEVTQRRVPAPGFRRGDCRACGHEAFLPVEGPALCEHCAFEPGELATDRETGDLVVVVRATDDRADAVEIDAADCTVAEYPTNDGYPRDDPVVEVAYPFAGRPIGDRPRYAFPHSRLVRGAASVTEKSG